MAQWQEYQGEVAAFFRSLGLDAVTDVTLTGVRTTHDVDVVVTIDFLHFTLRWIVECKLWRTRVTKEKIFALRAIVDDLGADRGLVLSESGFQTGALEAARMTNVELVSLAELREVCRHDLARLQLRQIFLLAGGYRQRYWALSKETRIKYELRGDWVSTYNGEVVAKACELAVLHGLFYGFPVIYDEQMAVMVQTTAPDWDARPESFVADSPEALVPYLTDKLAELDRRLTRAEDPDES